MREREREKNNKIERGCERVKERERERESDRRGTLIFGEGEQRKEEEIESEWSGVV